MHGQITGMLLLLGRGVPAVANNAYGSSDNKKKDKEENLFHIFLLNLC